MSKAELQEHASCKYRAQGEKHQGEKHQVKVGMDGYDSENDEWLDIETDRLRVFEQNEDQKEARQQEVKGKENARRFAEQRKYEGRRHHQAVTGAPSMHP